MPNNEDMKTTFLVVKTPEREFWSAPIQELIVETPNGQIGILPGHERMAVAVSIGSILIKTADEKVEWKEAVVSEGFMEIDKEMIVLLVDTAEWPEEIDENRAKRAQARALERLQVQLSTEEYIRSKAALRRAIARLRVSSKRS